MITVEASKYEEFMATNEVELFGSNFDGVNYYFFESKAEADEQQAHVLAPVDVPNDQPIDMSNVDLSTMTQAQLDILVNILKSRL